MTESSATATSLAQSAATSHAPPSARPREPRLAVVAVGLLVALAFWPGWALVPTWGGDASWVLGLSWAADLGLQWGTDVVFTYGPLSFLKYPTVLAPIQIVLAGVVHVVATLGAIAAAYYLARTRLELAIMPALVAAAAASGLGLYLDMGSAVLVAIVLGSMALLVSRSWLVLVAIGMGLGLIGHQKLSEAILVLGVAFLCAVGGLGWRGVVGLAIVSLVAWLGFWMEAGQAPGNVLPWIVAAIDISTAHADALSTEMPDGSWHFPMAVFLSGSTLWLAWRAGASLGGRRQLVLVGAMLWSLWLAWNAAFNRHDPGHAMLFFETIIILVLALVLVGGRGRSLGLGLVTLAFAILFMNTLGGAFLGPLDRENSLTAAGRAATAITSAEVRAGWMDDTARDLAELHQITPELRAFLGDAATLADPGDISAIWAAAGPQWQPLPPLQLITSYTYSLDRMSLKSLQDRPRQILRDHGYGASDGRYPPWNSPLYQLEVYCRYSVEFETPRWQVLRPAAASRCGEPQDPQEVHVEANAAAAVPSRAGMMTVVTVEPEPSMLDRLRSLIFKPRTMYLDYAGQWRYAFGDVGNRLMLNAPYPHPAFPTQPLTPHASISIDTASRLTFEFIPVAAAQASTSGAVGISNVVIRAASAPASPRVAPEVLDTNEVRTATPAGECLVSTPLTDHDPFLVFAVPNGSGLQVESEGGGQAQVFMEIDGGYPPDQPLTFALTTEPVEVFMPRPNAAGAWNLRIDPPGTGETRVCLISVDS